MNGTDPFGTDACPTDDKSCIQDPSTETPNLAPPGGQPVTPKQKELDQVVVQARKDKKIGDTPFNPNIEYPQEQHGKIEEVTVTAVRGKQVTC